MLLKDKVALVTGAANGIGAACATALAEAGAHVVLADIDGGAVERAAQVLAGRQHRTLALAADVGDVAAIQGMVDAAMTRFGQIDILVNNAGVTRRADIMDVTEADWDRIHRVNAKGVFFCLQAVARTMIPRRQGRIVNIASIAGKGYVGASNAAYAASKGAVIGLTRLAALQLAKHDINVNAVCPGVTRTALADANLRVAAEQAGIALEEMAQRRAAIIPLQRANEPEDVAAMVVFLASPAARNITGQSLNVDGGLVFD